MNEGISSDWRYGGRQGTRRVCKKNQWYIIYVVRNHCMANKEIKITGNVSMIKEHLMVTQTMTGILQIKDNLRFR